MLSSLRRAPRHLILAGVAALAAAAIALPRAGLAQIPPPPATLSTTLSGPATVAPGSLVSYTLTVSDVEPIETAYNVDFAFEVPATLGTLSAISTDSGAASCTPIVGTNQGAECLLGVLPAGASVSLTVTIQVGSTLTPPLPPFLALYASFASNAAPSGLLSFAITVGNGSSGGPGSPPPQGPYNGPTYRPYMPVL